jgi:hypothetical protein
MICIHTKDSPSDLPALAAGLVAVTLWLAAVGGALCLAGVAVARRR